jgi:Biotin carboxyl carrier protein
MNVQDIERLVHRLEAGRITECDFDNGDGSTLLLRFEPAASSIDAPAKLPPVAGLPAPPIAKMLVAPRFGHFLHRHPFSDVGRVELGCVVAVGDIVGFIHAGDLLVPVCSSHAGIVSRILIDKQTLVGYGQTLATVD